MRGTGIARSFLFAAGAIEQGRKDYLSLIKKGMRPQGRKDSLSYKKGHEAARPATSQPTNPDLD